MKSALRPFLLALCLLALAVPLLADESEDDYEHDARFAEGSPPMVPHRIEENATGESCLACHRTGLHGAPLSPHMVRLECTGCHGQGEIRKKIEKSKHGKKKKHD